MYNNFVMLDLLVSKTTLLKRFEKCTNVSKLYTQCGEDLSICQYSIFLQTHISLSLYFAAAQLFWHKMREKYPNRQIFRWKIQMMISYE